MAVNDLNIWLPALYVGEQPEALAVTVLNPTTGGPVDVTGSSPVFRFRVGADGTVTQRACTVVNGPAGVIRYDWQPGDLAAAGLLEGVIRYTIAGADRVAAIVRGMVWSLPVPLR